jgi:hypothetical protein
LLKDKKKADSLILLSNNDRDPGQHLYHLLNLNVFNSPNMTALKNFLNGPRHLFLFNPERMIYESARSNEKDLSNLLSLGLPIYHKQKIGNIWGAYSKNGVNSLFIDDRNQGRLSCN